MPIHKVPIINFSRNELSPGTSSWCSVRSEVRQALEDYGCFEAKFDLIPQDLHIATFGALKQLFDLTCETKTKNNFDQPFEGYTGSSPHMPLYESMGINDVVALERLQSFTNLMWPEGNSSFCETIMSFLIQVLKMEQMVKRMVVESFGVDEYYKSLEERTCYLLRVMKYRAPRTTETDLGLFSHTDKDFVTILAQNEVHGLEVQAKDGEWMSVKPSSWSPVVMIGDAFMAWSNGRLYSPPHRVKMTVGNNTRYSMGLFSFCKDIVQTPKELVDEEHPLLFKPFDNIGLRHFVRSQEAQKAESIIKAYCGA